MFVYDVTCEESFENITKLWMSSVIKVSYNIKACLHYESN